jgi:hypothetical protein
MKSSHNSIHLKLKLITVFFIHLCHLLSEIIIINTVCLPKYCCFINLNKIILILGT